MSAHRFEAAAGSEAEMKSVTPFPPTEIYEPGVDLTSQGEVAACVYLVVEGLVKLVHALPDGGERIVELLGEKDFVGVHSAVLAESCFETAVTLTKCRLARWRASEFLVRLKCDAGLAVQVCRMISRHVRALQCRLVESGVQPARRRFEVLLQWFAERGTRGPVKPAVGFDLPLTRDELSEFLFVTPFQVSRLLSAAEKDGIIARQGRHIRVLPAALRRAAAQPA